MPCLKSNPSAGISVAAKNHQGSVIGPNQDATNQNMVSYLHYDFPVDGGPSNQVMGIYRHLVDYMAHKKLGGNTLIYIYDAIWSGNNSFGNIEKWQMPPFNNNWTSSLFISQDAVAIESIGFDFLYNEYKDYPQSHRKANFPLVNGVQDYIHQAADTNNWPAGIKYDPSSPDHSSPVGSLGVHEHWNNSVEKKGIELYSEIESVNTYDTFVISNTGLTIFPNPVKDIATLKYVLSKSTIIHLELYSLDGKLIINSKKIKQKEGLNTIKLNVVDYKLPIGTYMCKVIPDNNVLKALISKIIVVN
jgi:hypothetical protein